MRPCTGAGNRGHTPLELLLQCLPAGARHSFPRAAAEIRLFGKVYSSLVARRHGVGSQATAGALLGEDERTTINKGTELQQRGDPNGTHAAIT